MDTPGEDQQGNIITGLEQGKGTESRHGSSPGTSTAPAPKRHLLFPQRQANVLESQQLRTSPALAKHQGFTRARAAKRIRPQGI